MGYGDIFTTTSIFLILFILCDTSINPDDNNGNVEVTLKGLFNNALYLIQDIFV